MNKKIIVFPRPHYARGICFFLIFLGFLLRCNLARNCNLLDHPHPRRAFHKLALNLVHSRNLRRLFAFRAFFSGNDNSISIRSVNRCNAMSQCFAALWQWKQYLHAATTAACNPRISEFSIPAESAIYRAAPPAAAASRSSASICNNIFWLWVATVMNYSPMLRRTPLCNPDNNTTHLRTGVRSIVPCR